MQLKLEDKTVLIGGSTRGIGLEIAREFLREKAKVILSGRNQSDLDSASEQLEDEFPDRTVAAYRTDLSQADQVDQLVSSVAGRFGSLDCVVANAGSGRGSSSWQLDRNEWERILEANLYPSVLLAQRAAQSMSSGGSIVLIGSIAAITALPAPIPYSAAKAALTRYSFDLASRLGPSGIRVNMVVPGNIFFSGGSWQEQLEADREATELYVKERVPLARFGVPEEISAAVAFISSTRASFTTGSCLVVDGGQSLG